MSEVSILLSDDDIGYWEWKVVTEDGEWILEATRGKKVDPERANAVDDYDKYELYTSVKHNGAVLFSIPQGFAASLMPYDMNGLVASASLGAVAAWAIETKKYQAVRALIGALSKDLLEQVDREFAEIYGDDAFALCPKEIADVIEKYDRQLCKVAGALFEHGMEHTTDEWRFMFLGNKELYNPYPGAE